MLLIGFSCMVLVGYIFRLIFLQLVNGEKYLDKASSTTNYAFSITAARGEIVDCYGRSIATNSTGYSVIINKLMLGKQDLNELLQKLVKILERNGESWNDTMMIGRPDENGSYSFIAEESNEQQQKSLQTLKSAMGLQQYATADEVMAKVVQKYDLQDYDATWRRILGGIRYQMQLEEFSNYNNFTLAEDVSDKTMATIKEQSLSLNGAEIMYTTIRDYPDGTLIPAMLGSVGKITAEQWKADDYALRRAGYAMSDTIGQAGLEAVYESALRGSDGVETITRNADGIIVSTEVTKQPQPGQTLVLTINKDLQKKVDEALEAHILELQQTRAAGAGKECNAGAVVVLNAKTGGVLAVSNYPSYDLNLYSANYSTYASDPALPLYNRALQGQYTPGSTFKPAVAVAALVNGVIQPEDTVNCTGTYTYYSDYHPGCLQISHRGPVNLFTAIQYSCNIFFYDVGRRTGIDVYDQVAQSLGLGIKTGLEVGEGTGHLTQKTDDNYTNGLELQAAIGQGNTVVTPVQLATYANTLANKGVRYRTHLVQGLRDGNTGASIQEFDPVVEEVIKDNTGAFDAVQQGMALVTGTLRALSDYPYTIATKTGSPQRGDTYTTAGGRRTNYVNSVMIGYGPVEDPEIAVAIVLEYGGGGSNAAPLMADIFNAYFFDKTSDLAVTPEGQLVQ